MRSHSRGHAQRSGGNTCEHPRRQHAEGSGAMRSMPTGPPGSGAYSGHAVPAPLRTNESSDFAPKNPKSSSSAYAKNTMKSPASWPPGRTCRALPGAVGRRERVPACASA
eukprot:2947480-Alexandrium_andersonii.AAC.1